MFSLMNNVYDYNVMLYVLKTNYECAKGSLFGDNDTDYPWGGDGMF